MAPRGLPPYPNPLHMAFLRARDISGGSDDGHDNGGGGGGGGGGDCGNITCECRGGGGSEDGGGGGSGDVEGGGSDSGGASCSDDGDGAGDGDGGGLCHTRVLPDTPAYRGRCRRWQRWCRVVLPRRRQ